jgi:hypothetical protein
VPRRRSRAVDKAKVRDYVLLTIGGLGLLIQFVFLPLVGHAWEPNQLLLVGAELYACGLPLQLPGGLFTSQRKPKDDHE